MTRAGDNAAVFAARFGVTVKALRVYERHGLLTPARTASGWRAFSEKDAERLTAVLALKRLGLPLARVGSLLKGFRGDLDAVLALQEQALSQRHTEVSDALDLVRRARRRIASGASLSADDLATLAKETAMTDTKWTPELEALAGKHYTSEQREALAARKFDMGDQAAIAAEWGAIFSDGEKLLGSDPASPPAQAWAARWKTAVEKFTQGDAGLNQSAARFNAEALNDPSTRQQMPGSPEIWAFAMAAMKVLAVKG